MCEFKDQDGQIILPGDVIERWNPRLKDWVKYLVTEVTGTQYLKHDYQTKRDEQALDLFIKARPEDTDTRSGQKFWSHSPSRLRKFADIRKVV